MAADNGTIRVSVFRTKAFSAADETGDSSDVFVWDCQQTQLLGRMKSLRLYLFLSHFDVVCGGLQAALNLSSGDLAI